MLKKLLSVAAALALLTGTIDARGMGHKNGSENNKKSHNSSKKSSKQHKKHAGGKANHGDCDATDTALSVLSEELANTLAYMGNEERLAYDVYNTLYAEWGTRQFINTASKSEIKHIQAVQELVKKYKLSDDINFTNVDLPALGYSNTSVEDMEAGTYDISHMQKLYDDLVAKGSTSEIDALEVGCMVEVIDVDDLDKYIVLAEESNASDVKETFEFLRAGSYNHYWAFDKGLKNKGISDGCCALGTVDGINYCHPEYPQK